MRAFPNESPRRLSTVRGPELHTLHVPHLQQDVRPWLLPHLSPQEEAPLPVAARAQSLQVSTTHPVCNPSLPPLVFFLTFMVFYGHRKHKVYYTLFRSAPDTQCAVLLLLHIVQVSARHPVCSPSLITYYSGQRQTPSVQSFSSSTSSFHLVWCFTATETVRFITHTYTHTHADSRTHADTTLTHTHAHTHTLSLSHTHTLTHTHTRTRTHTHTHTSSLELQTLHSPTLKY